jgi:diacylglycerol O-acyltransferase/trehalose O-mycolyltransferase
MITRTIRKRNVLSLLVTGFVVASLATGVAAQAPASAGPRITPSGCEQIGQTDGLRCTVHSASMDRDIPVLVRPSLTPDNPEVATFLDGGNNQGSNGWVSTLKILDHLPEEDKTLAFPVMDKWTWTQDFDGLDAVQFETFVADELPDYLEKTFHVPHGGRGTTGIAGLSSGAYGAMNLAGKYPDQYNAVYALSGLYDPQQPLQGYVIDNTAQERSDYGRGPWENDESRAQNNPTLNIDKLGMPVLVSASSGLPNFANLGPDPVAVITEGAPYEFGSMVFTRELQARTTLAGKSNFTYRYDLLGAHDWDTWRRAAVDQGGVDAFLASMDGGGEASGSVDSSGAGSVTTS